MATFSHDIFKKEYHKDDDQTKTRTVGIEFEVVITDDKDPLYRENIENNLFRHNTYRSLMDVLEETKIKEFFPGAGFDGSDIELVTHPDSITLYREGGSKRFKKAMEYLSEHAVGGEQAINSGTHINVGKLDSDDADYIMDNAYWICMNFAIQLQKIAGRVTHWAKFTPYTGEKKYQVSINQDIPNTSMVLAGKPEMMRNHASRDNKGLCLVDKPNTYEFRIFKSTTNINEASAWTELCYNIIELASGAKAIEDIRFVDLIIGPHIRDYVYGLEGRRKLDAVELAASIKNTLSFRTYATEENVIL